MSTIKQLLQAREQNDEVLKSLRALGLVQKHDLTSTVDTFRPPHGPGGILSGSGVRPEMYATLPGMMNEWLDTVSLYPSKLVNEVYEILTGQTDVEGTAAADVCSDGPVPGVFKVCRQTIPYGALKVDTRVTHVPDLGRRIDYADLDRRILNMPETQLRFVPQVTGLNINTPAGKQLMELGAAVRRAFILCDANGVAGTVGGAGAYALWMTQYDGIESWVKTGYVDAVTHVACPAADSVVINHSADIDAAGANGRTFVQNMVDMIYSIRQRAETFGMQDFVGAIVCHPKMERCLYYQWACAYYTDHCSGGQYHENNTNAIELTKFRDQMMNGHFILVDGMPVPVIAHTGLPTPAVQNGEITGDYFFMPLEWAGRPLTYYQYYPMTASEIQEVTGFVPEGFRSYNNGLYLAWSTRTHGCMKLEFTSKVRLIVDTPWLAGRVNDVECNYWAQTRDLNPGESLYADGGQSSRWPAGSDYIQRV